MKKITSTKWINLLNLKKTAIPALVILGFWGIVVLFTRNLYPLPQIHAAQDFGIFIDSAYRLTQGQLPHRDYSSILGPVFAFFTGLPLLLGGAYYDSFTLYPALLGAFFSILTAIAMRKLLESTLLVAFALAVGLTAGGTFQVGNPPEWLSFSTHYSRISYSFIMILFGVCFLPPHKDRRVETERALLSGFFTAVLFFLKINYFFVSCLVVAIGVVVFIGRSPLRYISLATISFLIIFIIGFFILNWDVSGYIRDMRMIAAVRIDKPAGVTDYTAGTILASNLPILTMALVLLVCLYQRRCWRGLLGSFCIVSLTLLIGISQSSGAGFGLPSLAAAFVVSAAWLVGNPTPASPIDKISRTAVLGMTFAAIVWFIALPQISSYAAWVKISTDITNHYGPPRRNLNDPISTLFVGDRNTWGRNFIPLIAEARSLANSHVRINETVAYLDYTNPISFAGGFKSPKNSCLDYDMYVNISPNFFIPPVELFSYVDYAIIPKNPIGKEHLKLCLDIYGNYLSKSFKQIADSENFSLLKKNKNKHY